MAIAIEAPKVFSHAQYEVLNTISCLRDESDVTALKSVLVKFLNDRLQGELDKLYDDGTLSEEKMAELSKTHLRTPYKVAV